MTEEITEVKSAYEKEIEKFLKSGGKVKYHHPDKKKIAKMTASFKKSFKIKMKFRKSFEYIYQNQLNK